MRVLGVDPGLTRCGLGVVEGSVGRPLTMRDVGVVRTDSDLPTALRLCEIERGIEAWLDEHRPGTPAEPAPLAEARRASCSAGRRDSAAPPRSRPRRS